MSSGRMEAVSPMPMPDKELHWPKEYDDLFDAYIASDGHSLREAIAPGSRSSETPAVRRSSTDSAASLDRPDSTGVAGDHSIASLLRSDLSARQTRFSDSEPSALGLSLEAPRTPQKLTLAATPPQDRLTVLEPASPGSTSTALAISSIQTTTHSAHFPLLNPSCATPTMAQPSFSRRGLQDAWAQRLEANADKYNQQALVTSPLSPPPSAKLLQWDDHSFMNPAPDSQAPNHTAPTQRPLTYHSMTTPLVESAVSQQISSPITPQASPSLGRSNSCGFNYNTQMTSPHTSQYGFTSNHRSSFASPAADYDAIWEGDQSGFPFAYQSSTSAPYDESKVQPWWPPNSSAATRGSNVKSGTAGDSFPMHAGGPVNYKQETDSHRHYSDSNLVLGDSSSFATGGLMISCMPSESVTGTSGPSASMRTAGPRASSSDMPNTTFPGYVGSSMEVPEHYNPAQYVGSAPGLLVSHRNGSRDSTSSQRSHPYHQPSSANHHRRGKTSMSKSSVGFVNYTPDDSKKILTGVAPSGSSKTKARREKEAAERRRRLEQAAARAVLEAGGDMAALEREGLLA